MRPHRVLAPTLAAATLALFAPAGAQYINFESSHVHPIDLTPSGTKLLVVNTPDALLEVFSVGASGDLTPLPPIRVGLEPVTVVAQSDSQAWVVNHLSDSVSIVDLDLGTTIRTLPVGDEPTDVAFARGKAFVTVSQEDSIKVFDLSDLGAAPAVVSLFGSDPRALAVSPGSGSVYAVALNSGNQTTIVNANVIASNNSGLDPNRLVQLGLNDIECNGAPPAYPPLPPGIVRNPSLPDPVAPAQPPVSLIVKWDLASGKWKDETGADWTHCLPYRLPDHDLFVIDANSPGPPAFVDHVGTSLFEVSVNPVNGKIYVPNTDARNFVRFEHALGVRGHMVDNQISIVDPGAGFSVTKVDLNSHINRASDPATNMAERQASISQPGMMVWNSSGTTAYLTAIGSRKLFRVDGGCASGACIFGSLRSVPDAVDVGEGPTGVALHEERDRLYVLNRFSNSIALVRASTLTKLGEVPLHDPSSATIKNGRRLLYDGIDTSGHGDAACSSCHISGHMDELAWDLGDPTGDFAPYAAAGDNVRFIIPLGNQPVECQAAQFPNGCAAHNGFDPQKGPMTTQTLRGMLEPLHWRGDRPTMVSFNKAFVGLMGTQDIGPINNEPAGLSGPLMDLYRQFALGIQFPPNPHRNVNDTLPNIAVTIPGHQQPGNPTAGQTLFLTGRTDANQACVSCHTLPFGAGGGKLGGVEPGDPSTAMAALFNGDADGSPHSDLKVPHLRNMYEKFGPRFGSHTNPGDPPADQKTGFGFTHDGAVPDMGTFLSASVFTLTAQQARDISAFMFFFSTDVKPSVGRHVTVPAGTPPPGPPAGAELLLATLIGVGNLADTGRHCELTASAVVAGRERTWYLNGGGGAGGLWTTDVDGEAQVTTQALRVGAGGPITFMCVTIGSGVRVGADRDTDARFNGSDCSDGDPAFFASPVEVSGLSAAAASPLLSWDEQGSQVGPGLSYDVVGGTLSALHGSSIGASTSCLAGDLTSPSFDDTRPAPPPGDGYYYLARARTPECTGGFGFGRGAIEPLRCEGI